MERDDPLSEGITFRPWRPTDIDALVRYLDNPRIALNMKDRFPHPYRAEDAERWIALNAVAGRPFTSFAIDRGGEAIGGVLAEPCADIFRRTAEISYWVAEPFWQRNVGTRAARYITEYAFLNMPIVRLQALVFDWNPASARILTKAGYTLEGRLQKAVTKETRTGDILVYAKIRA